jgi:hypothetical protein
VNTSQYGPEFDRLAEIWRVVEGEHDKQHPDRSKCGGVGGCTSMRSAVDLEQDMIGALEEWRRL